MLAGADQSLLPVLVLVGLAVGGLLLFLFYLLGVLIPRMQRMIDSGRENVESLTAKLEAQQRESARKINDLQTRVNRFAHVDLSSIQDDRKQLRDSRLELLVASRRQDRYEQSLGQLRTELSLQRDSLARQQRGAGLALLVQKRCLARREQCFAKFRADSAARSRSESLASHVTRRHRDRLAAEIKQHQETSRGDRAIISALQKQQTRQTARMKQNRAQLRLRQLELREQTDQVMSLGRILASSRMRAKQVGAAAIRERRAHRDLQSQLREHSAKMVQDRIEHSERQIDQLRTLQNEVQSSNGNSGELLRLMNQLAAKSDSI